MKAPFNIKPNGPVLLGMLLSLTAVQGSAPDRVGKYDFSYEARGDQRAKPAQVFDDGSSTFFQFRAGEALPTILATTATGPQLLVPNIEGPYARVPVVSGHFILRMGHSTSDVAYLGGGRQLPPSVVSSNAEPQTSSVAMARLLAAAGQVQGLPEEMTRAVPQAQLELNSYATPLRGDRVQWTTSEVASPLASVSFVRGKGTAGPQAARQVRGLSKTMMDAQRIVVTGIDDSSYAEGVAEKRAQAVADLLVSAGIARDRIALKTSAQPLDADDQAVVTGASIVAYTTQAHRPPRAPTGATASDIDIAAAVPKQSMNDTTLADVVAKLKAGQMAPAEAMEALEKYRTTRELPQPAKAVVGKWDVRASDGNVTAMLQRWGASSGWRVVIKDAPEIRIHGDAVVERPTFLQAADYAISQAKGAGYSIKASAFTNNVLLLTAGDSK